MDSVTPLILPPPPHYKSSAGLDIGTSVNNKSIETVLGDTDSTDNEIAMALSNVLKSATNGEPISHLVLPIIKNASARNNHNIKRLLHFLWPLIECYDSDGRLKSYIIMISQAILRDLEHANEYIVCSALRCVAGLQCKEVIEHVINAVSGLTQHSFACVRSAAVSALHSVGKRFFNTIPIDYNIIQSMIIATPNYDGEIDESMLEPVSAVIRRALLLLADCNIEMLSNCVISLLTPGANSSVHMSFKEDQEFALAILEAVPPCIKFLKDTGKLEEMEYVIHKLTDISGVPFSNHYSTTSSITLDQYNKTKEVDILNSLFPYDNSILFALVSTSLALNSITSTTAQLCIDLAAGCINSKKFSPLSEINIFRMMYIAANSALGSGTLNYETTLYSLNKICQNRLGNNYEEKKQISNTDKTIIAKLINLAFNLADRIIKSNLHSNLSLDIVKSISFKNLKIAYIDPLDECIKNGDLDYFSEEKIISLTVNLEKSVNEIFSYIEKNKLYTCTKLEETFIQDITISIATFINYFESEEMDINSNRQRICESFIRVIKQFFIISPKTVLPAIYQIFTEIVNYELFRQIIQIFNLDIIKNDITVYAAICCLLMNIVNNNGLINVIDNMIEDCFQGENTKNIDQLLTNIVSPQKNNANNEGDQNSEEKNNLKMKYYPISKDLMYNENDASLTILFLVQVLCQTFKQILDNSPTEKIFNSMKSRFMFAISSILRPYVASSSNKTSLSYNIKIAKKALIDTINSKYDEKNNLPKQTKSNKKLTEEKVQFSDILDEEEKKKQDLFKNVFGMTIEDVKENNIKIPKSFSDSVTYSIVPPVTKRLTFNELEENDAFNKTEVTDALYTKKFIEKNSLFEPISQKKQINNDSDQQVLLANVPDDLLRIHQFSGDSDRIYCEALVIITPGIVTLNVLFVNRSDEIITDLKLELSTAGKLNIVNANSGITPMEGISIPPHGIATSVYRMLTPSCEAGVIFGSISATFNQAKTRKDQSTMRDVVHRTQELFIDVTDFLCTPKSITENEFKRTWGSLISNSSRNIEEGSYEIITTSNEDIIAIAEKISTILKAGSIIEDNEKEGEQSITLLVKNLYMKTITDEIALANLTLIKDPTSKNIVTGVIKIRSTTNALTQALIEKLSRSIYG